MSLEKETATVAAVSSQGNGFFARDTVNILAQMVASFAGRVS